MKVRKAAAALAFALILFGGFETYYLRTFAQDRQAFRQMLEELPWRKLPGFRSFLLDVRAATADGESVALWIEPMDWMRGYEYGYVRAGYLLGGRDVLPLLTPEGSVLAANAHAADVIACYGCRRAPESFRVVRASSAGLILRRR